jgi:hypothetical protein
MPTYLMVTETSELEQIRLREAMSAKWPELEWLRAPALLETGSYLGVFQLPIEHPVEELSRFLARRGVAEAELRVAPSWTTVHDVVEAMEQRPETD